MRQLLLANLSIIFHILLVSTPRIAPVGGMIIEVTFHSSTTRVVVCKPIFLVVVGPNSNSTIVVVCYRTCRYYEREKRKREKDEENLAIGWTFHILSCTSSWWHCRISRVSGSNIFWGPDGCVQVASSVLIVGSLGLSSFVNRSASSGGFVGTTNAGRQALNQTSSSMNGLWPRLLQEEISPLGEVFGWIMASIYMGGRLPQIWLNVIFSL